MIVHVHVVSLGIVPITEYLVYKDQFQKLVFWCLVTVYKYYKTMNK